MVVTKASFIVVFATALIASASAFAEDRVVRYCDYDGTAIQKSENMNSSARFDGRIELRPNGKPNQYVGEQNLDFGVGRIRIEADLSNQKYLLRTTITAGSELLLKAGRWTNLPSQGSRLYKSELFGVVIQRLMSLHPNVSPWDMLWESEFPIDKKVVQYITISCLVGLKPKPSVWDYFEF